MSNQTNRFSRLINTNRYADQAAAERQADLAKFHERLDSLRTLAETTSDPIRSNSYTWLWRTMGEELGFIADDLDRGLITTNDLPAAYRQWTDLGLSYVRTITDNGDAATVLADDAAVPDTAQAQEGDTHLEWHAVAVRRPVHGTIYLGYRYAFQAQAAATDLRQQLTSTSHVPGTVIEAVDQIPPGAVVTAPLATDPYAIAQAIRAEAGQAEPAQQFPDTYSRLAAQEGHEAVGKPWNHALDIISADEAADEEAQLEAADQDAAAAARPVNDVLTNADRQAAVRFGGADGDQLVVEDASSRGRPADTGEAAANVDTHRTIAEEHDSTQMVDDARVLAHLRGRSVSHPEAGAARLWDMDPERWTKSVERLREQGHRIEESMTRFPDSVGPERAYKFRQEPSELQGDPTRSTPEQASAAEACDSGKAADHDERDVSEAIDSCACSVAVSRASAAVAGGADQRVDDAADNDRDGQLARWHDDELAAQRHVNDQATNTSAADDTVSRD